MKKIISIIILILITAGLSACGNQSVGTSAQDVKQENMQDSATLLSDETPYILYQIQADSIDDNLKDKVKNTLDERLESLNYGEALVQIEGDDEVAIVFPSDVDNVEEIADRLNVTSKLTFEDYQGNIFMTGQDVQEVKVEYGPFTGVNEDGYYLSLEFTETGKSKFKDATAQIAELSEPNNYLAIKLNDEIITTPSVSEAIDSNSCIISGNFDKHEANQIATSIKGSSLPFSLSMVKVNNPNADSTYSENESMGKAKKTETPNDKTTSPSPMPEKVLYRAVAETNAVIVQDDFEGHISYKKKCDVCGWIDGSTQVVTLATVNDSGMSSSFYCPTCKEQRTVKLKVYEIEND